MRCECASARDNLVFAPGETFSFSVEPHVLPLPERRQRAGQDSTSRAAPRNSGRSSRTWPVDGQQAIPVEVPLPSEEGVYDVAVTAASSPNWSQAVRQPLELEAHGRRAARATAGAPPPARRRRRPLGSSCAVGRRSTRPIRNGSRSSTRNSAACRNCRWARPNCRGSGKGRWATAACQSRRHALGELAELRPNAESPDVSWEAYWLPISQPGRPHIVEVDYPSDVPQTLGLCILEPDAAGAMAPVGSGLGRGQRRGAGRAQPDAPLAAASPDLLAPHQHAAAAGQQRPRPGAGRVRKDPRLGRRRAPAADDDRADVGRPPAAGRLSRPAAGARELLGQRVSRFSERPQPATTGKPSTKAARGWSSICNSRRLQRLDAGRAGRRQHDLSQPVARAHAALRHRSVFSPPARTRSAKTCWRCFFACSIGTICD